MKIEAVTTCVNYCDYLSHTILWNKPLFDKFVVVTDKADHWTRDLCEHHHVYCVTTDFFYEGERSFVKSNGINAGIAALDADAWIAHLDADVVLPPRTRSLIEAAELDPQTIYGVDRIMCSSFEDWLEYMAWPEVQVSCDVFIQANAFPLGTRVAKAQEDGWAPIGFFQLWNAGATKVTVYPDHGRADRSDLAFARQWPRGKRALIPEVVAIHLAADEDSTMGVNWGGRKSTSFGPLPKKVHMKARGDYQ